MPLSYVAVLYYCVFVPQIGSEWDGKESIFRNYPGILGPWDHPVAALRLVAGQLTTINIIWDDPLKERIATFSMKLEAAWTVTYHKPKLELPIRPGIWGVHLELPDGTLLMKTQFLVVPMTHHNGVQLDNPQTINAKQTAQPDKVVSQEEYDKWLENVNKSGLELDEWMDELVKDYWTIDNYCRMDMSQSGGDQCSWIQDCFTTSFSTFAPDPKTELVEISSNGKIG